MKKQEETQSPASKKLKILRSVRDFIAVILVAMLLSFLVKTFLFKTFYIPSGSMEHTLEINDNVTVNMISGVDRGDVVVFKDPGGWLNIPPTKSASAFEHLLGFIGFAPGTENDYLIKRVIGKPGDHVKCCNADGKITVNGKPLDEPYIVRPVGENRSSGIPFDVLVPEDSYWVMGDNRYSSKDSRYNQDQPGKGFVPKKNIVGKAFLLSLPLNRFTLLSNYPDTFKDIPLKEPETGANG